MTNDREREFYKLQNEKKAVDAKLEKQKQLTRNIIYSGIFGCFMFGSLNCGAWEHGATWKETGIAMLKAALEGFGVYCIIGATGFVAYFFLSLWIYKREDEPYKSLLKFIFICAAGIFIIGMAIASHTPALGRE